ncbi:MAG: glycosyltransferase [Sneathiella sp.]|nr:glycosyltransferase [Sneathiella sp.]
MFREIGLWPPHGLSDIHEFGRSRLVWHGHLAEVRPAITAAHFAVLPSYQEGTLRTIFEGMAMDRSIITTDAPGC